MIFSCKRDAVSYIGGDLYGYPLRRLPTSLQIRLRTCYVPPVIDGRGSCLPISIRVGRASSVAAVAVAVSTPASAADMSM